MAKQILSNEESLTNLGYLEDDLKKPLVGIIYSSIEILNSNLNRLIENVKNGVVATGGNAIVLACPSLGSGVLNPDKYDMPARELTANTVEMYCLENGFDALVLVGNDNILATGLLMGAARVNLPSIYLSAVCCKMACVCEVLGISLRGSGTYDNFSPERLRLATKTGKTIVEACKNQLSIRKVITKDALKNALKFNLSALASVNILINLFAIGYELKIPEKDFGVDMLNQISDTTPTLCVSNPNFYERLENAGGVFAVLKELFASSVTSTTMIDNVSLSEKIKRAENSDDDFIKSLNSAYAPNSSLVLIKGNLSESGAFCKRLFLPKELLNFSGPAKVYDSLETAQYGIISGDVKDKDILVIKFEGAKASGIRKIDLDKYLKKANIENIAVITDGRIRGNLNYLKISCVSPESLNGGNIAAIQNGDIIEFNIPRFSFNAKVSSKDLDKRLRQMEMPEKQGTGFLKRYALSVSDSIKGAYLK